MNKTIKKTLPLILIGITIIVLLINFNSNRKIYFSNSNRIQSQLDKVAHAELKLNYTVLKSTIFLFNNNDDIIKSIKNLHGTVIDLTKNIYFKEEYPDLYKKFTQRYKKLVENKIEAIYEFNTINSGIKNSNTFLINSISTISSMRARYDVEIPHKYLKRVLSTISNILMSKNSMNNFIKSENIKLIEETKINNKKLNEFNIIMIAHLEMINKNFPKYQKLLNSITDIESQKIISSINDKFFTLNLKRVNKMNYIFYSIIFFIIFYTALIIYLFLKLDKENCRLNRSIREDYLTKLYNRNKFEEVINQYNNPILFLVNINKFRHINEYYGTEIGDKVLINVANILKELTQKEDPILFRLGADDFGILIKSISQVDKNDYATMLIEWFENNEINIKDLKFRIGIQIGISKEKPYFEKADMALIEAKESIREKYIIYRPHHNKQDLIKTNIEKTKVLYNAIKKDKIVPFFQPIVDIQTKKIVKYEVLARVVHKNSDIETIFPYLQIAKDNKLYFDITKAMLAKSADLFFKKNINFNINFSIEDIKDKRVLDILDEIEKKYPGIFNKITFEILESEAINDYKSIEEFISTVKSKGAKIAIDDFGSGYSNFEHLLNLQIDYLKIDGSLIKNIDKDENSKRIVKLISNFAKESNIEVVAEFIENESIHKVLKKLNIEFGQGYYFSKPLSSIS